MEERAANYFSLLAPLNNQITKKPPLIIANRITKGGFLGANKTL